MKLADDDSKRLNGNLRTNIGELLGTNGSKEHAFQPIDTGMFTILFGSDENRYVNIFSLHFD